MLSRTLGPSMLRDMSTGKGIMRAVKGVMRVFNFTPSFKQY